MLKMIHEIAKMDNISDFNAIKLHYNWSDISSKTYELYLKLM